MWLNRAAYETRKLAQEYINTNMMVRNKSFVRASLRYTKVNRGADLNSQASYVGSISLDGKTTGWAEQEKVRPDSRDKTVALAARGNNKKRSVRKGFRMNAKGSFRSPKGYKGGTAHRRAVALLAHVERDNIRQPILVYGHHNFPSGLFILRGRGKGRNFRALQIFGKQPAKTKPDAWLRKSAKRYMKTVNTRAVWGDIVRRLLNPPKKR